MLDILSNIYTKCLQTTLDIKEKWGKIRSIGGMSPSKEKDAATSKWFEEGEFKDWLVKLENSLPKQVLYSTLLFCSLIPVYFTPIFLIQTFISLFRRVLMVFVLGP